MSTNPISFRVGFESQIANLPVEHQQVIRTVWNAITDLQGAIPSLKSQIDTNKDSIATTNETINNNTSSETTVVVPASTSGLLNNQTGVTSYSTAPSDAGAYILFSDASAIAVTLSTLGSGGGIVLPFYCTILNEGVSLVTVTPSSGTISFPNNLAASSMPIAQGQAAIVVYDGNNFYSVIIPVQPQTIAAVTSKWLNSFTASTGIFTSAQPAFTDISGTVASSQLPDPTTSTLGGVEANSPIAHQWLNSINTSGIPQLSQPTAADVVPASSTTSGRPTGVTTGFMDFDTTLGIPIWWNGTAWVNAVGTPV